MKGMKKPLALLLALVMAFSLLSVGAWADEEEFPVDPIAEVPVVEVEDEDENVSLAAAEGVFLADEDDFAALMDATVIEQYAKVGETTYSSEQWAEAVSAAVNNDAVLELVAQTATKYSLTLNADDVIIVKTKYTPEGGDTVQHSVTLTLPKSDETNSYSFTTASQDNGLKITVTTVATLVKYTNANGSVYYYAKMPTAYGNGTYELLGDVSATGNLYDAANVTAMTLDLNGHKLVSTAPDTQNGLWVGAQSTGLTVTIQDSVGGGLFQALDANVALLATKTNNHLIIGKGVTVRGTVFISGTGNTIDVYGAIDGSGTGYGISSNGSQTKQGTVNIYDGASIKANVNELAIYIPSGTWTISGGEIEGGNALLMKSGKLTVTGGSFTGIKTPPKDYQHNNNGYVSTTGEAILIDNSEVSYPEGKPVVSITGGTFTSVASVAMRTVGSQGDPVVGFVSGGKLISSKDYDGDLQDEILAPGYGIDGTGKVYQTVSAVEFTPAGENQIAQSLVKFPTTLESGTYKLLTDVTVAEPVYLKGDGADVTIDMGGFTLTSTVSGKDSRGFYLDTVSGGIKNATVTIQNGALSLPDAPRAFQFNKGTSNVSLTIGDKAVINLPSAPGDYSVASVWGAGNSVTLAESATVNAASSYGITLFGGAADKNSLTINGTIKAVTPIGTNGSNTLSGTITVGGKAVLESTGNDHAMYLPGKVDTTIEDGAKLSGGDAIYIKSGSLTIRGGEFTATRERKVYEYYGNGGRFTGDVIVVDNCSYPGGAPTVSIEGGTFTSKYGSAVGSYAYNKTDGADNEPVIGFIKDGTFKTEAVGVPVFTTDGKHESVEVADNLVVSGKRIDGEGKIVEATATLTPGTAEDTAAQTTTYTATETNSSESPFTIKVESGTTNATPSESATFTAPTTESGNTANEKVDLNAINMNAFLYDMIDNKVKDDNGSDVTLKKDGNDTISLSMSAKAPEGASNTTTSFTLEIHPAVKVGDKEFALPNGYIAKPMKVTLPGLIKGAKLLRILHHLADGTQESVKFEQNIGSGDVSFESASFSTFTFVNEPVASDNKASTLEMYTITGKGDTKNAKVDLADFDTTAEVKIMVKAGEKISTLSAYDITVTLPKGLSYVDNSSDLTLNSKSTNAEGVTTVRFLNAAENTGGTYYQFNANEEKEFGSFKVNATIDAVYQETLEVKVTAATLGKTMVENYEYTPFLPNTTALEGGTTTTPATFQLTKTWTVNFAQLNKKVDASEGTATYSTANLTVGHNKAMVFSDFDDAEKAYFDATELAKETPVLLPIAAGYQFNKWTEGSLAAPVTKDLTYTAEWKTVDYKITYADEDVEVKVGEWSKAQETYTIETKLDIPQPTKTGYTFKEWTIAPATGLGDNWYADGVTTGNPISGYGFYGDVTLTANWTPIVYTVTFEEEAGIVGTVDYDNMKVSNRGTDLKATKADGANNYTMKYTIETGIPVAITLTGYDFDGWKVKTDGVTGSSYVKDAVMEAITSSVDATTPANTKLYYGDVTLESQWSVKLKFAFANFRYAYDEDSLMLVEWDGVAGGQLNFKDSTEIKALFKTTEQKYIDAYKKAMSLGDSDTLPTQVYVTIVTKATKGNKGKNDADLKDLFLIKDKDGETALSNEKIKFTGDVASLESEKTLDDKITLADLSNASDLFADTKWFNYNQIGIKNRLNADADKSAEGTIGDLAEIILNQGLSVSEVLAKASSGT